MSEDIKQQGGLHSQAYLTPTSAPALGSLVLPAKNWPGFFPLLLENVEIKVVETETVHRHTAALMKELLRNGFWGLGVMLFHSLSFPFVEAVLLRDPTGT